MKCFENNKCYLCGSREIGIRYNKVRDRDDIKVLICENCGLVFLSKFSHINDAFYEDSGMNKGRIDFNDWLQQTKDDDERRYLYLQNKIRNKKVLDFGSGNGGFLIRAKEEANLIKGIELDKQVIHHYKNNNIPYAHDINDVTEKYDIITAFHVIEHLKNPIDILIKISNLLEDNGEIIIEVPNSEDVLLTLYDLDEFKRFTYWSCHLYLFNNNTIKTLVEKAGLKLKTIKQVQRYPLSNHLFWLAKGKPGGQKIWDQLNNDRLNKEYEKTLESLNLCDTIIATITK